MFIPLKCFGVGFLNIDLSPCVYTASCILQFWMFRSSVQPCKCPLCCCRIVNLKPETSQLIEPPCDVDEVLKKVHQYNGLYISGVFGAFHVKINELLLKLLWFWHHSFCFACFLASLEVSVFLVLQKGHQHQQNLTVIPLHKWSVISLISETSCILRGTRNVRFISYSSRVCCQIILSWFRIWICNRI